MRARIYSPSRTVTQSGSAKTGYWTLEFESEAPLKIEPLMGYTSSSDARRQVRLCFPTEREAVAYARKNGIPFRLEEPKPSRRHQLSYAENFRHDRRIPWTH